MELGFCMDHITSVIKYVWAKVSLYMHLIIALKHLSHFYIILYDHFYWVKLQRLIFFYIYVWIEIYIYLVVKKEHKRDH